MAAFRKTLHQCCKTSSMRALPRILKSATIFQRTLWIFAMIFGLTFGAYQFTKLLIQYFHYPTSVHIKEIDAHPPFPDVTVCHLDLEWTWKKVESIADFDMVAYKEKMENMMELIPKDDIVRQFFNTILNDYSFGIYLQNVPKFDEKKLIDIIHHQLVVDCSVTPVSDFIPRKCFQNKVVLHPEYGLCFTMEMPGAMNMDMILYLDDDKEETSRMFQGISQSEPNHQVGARVILHPHGSYPSNIDFSHFVLAGTDNEFDITASEHISKPAPYGTCANADDDDASVFSQGQECLKMCVKRRVLKQCDCLYIWFAQEKMERTPCCRIDEKHDNMTDIVDRLGCSIITINETFGNPDKFCKCQKPCEDFKYNYVSRSVPWPHRVFHLSFYTKYIMGLLPGDKFQEYENILTVNKTNPTEALKQVSKLDTITRNFVRMRFLNGQSTYLRYTETPMFSVESIIGTIGGLCNLWAGISFFTLIEMLDFFYQWLCKKEKASGSDKNGEITKINDQL